jgi:hypothetical protein
MKNIRYNISIILLNITVSIMPNCELKSLFAKFFSEYFSKDNIQIRKKCYKHYKNGKLYQVVGECLIQENGIWKKAVIYTEMYNSLKFVREKEEFLNKFRCKRDTLNLHKLGEEVNEQLNKETKESLTEWLSKKRDL